MPVYKQGVEDAVKKSLFTTIGDIIGASAVETPARIAAPASGQVLTGQGAGVLPAWAVAPSALVLLYANSGTNTQAAATTVDSIAISGLTAKDSLLVVFGVSALTQIVTGPVQLYFVTNGTNGPPFNDATSIAAGYHINGFVLLRQSQDDATRYEATSVDEYGTLTSGFSNTGMVRGGRPGGALTAWTGAWTLGLRHNAVVAGGTFRWSWAIYKIAGQ